MEFSCCLQAKGITPMKKAALDAALMPYKVFEDSWVDEEDNIIEYYSGDLVKWDSVEEDMTALSRLFSNATFRLLCYDGNKYDYYFHNGKMECCDWTPVEPTMIKW